MNTVTTFAKRQDARDFAKSVGAKVLDRKDTITAGEDRWAVEYVTSDTPAVQAVDVLSKLKDVAQRTEAVMETVQEVPAVKTLPVLSVPKRNKKVQKKSFVFNKKGNPVPVTMKRSFSSQQAA